MSNISWITQSIIFLILTEGILRQNKQWDLVYTYLNIGFKNFINWRANADILVELKSIPKLFLKISVISLAFIIFSISSGINNPYLTMMLSILFISGFIVYFSFEWVFNHKETLIEMKPMILFYILVGIIILGNILFNNTYPPELINQINYYNIKLPTQYEIVIYFIISYIFVMFLYYLFIWLFALVIPVSILIILFTTSYISRFISKKITKFGFIGFLGVIQILLFYLNS